MGQRLERTQVSHWLKCRVYEGDRKIVRTSSVMIMAAPRVNKNGQTVPVQGRDPVEKWLSRAVREFGG